MKIAIAHDHAGYEIKKDLISFLISEGHEVDDYGPQEYDKEDDYPDFMIPAAQSVAEGKNEKGILICTNGIGASILANKINNIKAALVYSNISAKKTREDHDSNIICLPAGERDFSEMKRYIQIWLSTAFEYGRHQRRMDKVMKLEN